jgi:hypothetical protein
LFARPATTTVRTLAPITLAIILLIAPRFTGSAAGTTRRTGAFSALPFKPVEAFVQTLDHIEDALKPRIRQVLRAAFRCATLNAILSRPAAGRTIFGHAVSVRAAAPTISAALFAALLRAATEVAATFRAAAALKAAPTLRATATFEAATLFRATAKVTATLGATATLRAATTFEAATAFGAAVHRAIRAAAFDPLAHALTHPLANLVTHALTDALAELGETVHDPLMLARGAGTATTATLRPKPLTAGPAETTHPALFAARPATLSAIAPAFGTTVALRTAAALKATTPLRTTTPLRAATTFKATATFGTTTTFKATATFGAATTFGTTVALRAAATGLFARELDELVEHHDVGFDRSFLVSDFGVLRRLESDRGAGGKSKGQAGSEQGRDQHGNSSPGLARLVTGRTGLSSTLVASEAGRASARRGPRGRNRHRLTQFIPGIELEHVAHAATFDDLSDDRDLVPLSASDGLGGEKNSVGDLAQHNAFLHALIAILIESFVSRKRNRPDIRHTQPGFLNLLIQLCDHVELARRGEREHRRGHPSAPHTHPGNPRGDLGPFGATRQIHAFREIPRRAHDRLDRSLVPLRHRKLAPHPRILRRERLQRRPFRR